MLPCSCSSLLPIVSHLTLPCLSSPSYAIKSYSTTSFLVPLYTLSNSNLTPSFPPTLHSSYKNSFPTSSNSTISPSITSSVFSLFLNHQPNALSVSFFFSLSLPPSRSSIQTSLHQPPTQHIPLFLSLSLSTSNPRLPRSPSLPFSLSFFDSNLSPSPPSFQPNQQTTIHMVCERANTNRRFVQRSQLTQRTTISNLNTSDDKKGSSTTLSDVYI